MIDIRNGNVTDYLTTDLDELREAIVRIGNLDTQDIQRIDFIWRHRVANVISSGRPNELETLWMHITATCGKIKSFGRRNDDLTARWCGMAAVLTARPWK